jgi:hypothetical protein
MNCPMCLGYIDIGEEIEDENLAHIYLTPPCDNPKKYYASCSRCMASGIVQDNFIITWSGRTMDGKPVLRPIPVKKLTRYDIVKR